MRNPDAAPDRRDRAAELTLGYMHPKISNAPPPEPERPVTSTTVNIISIPNGQYLSREEAANFTRRIELLPEPEPVEVEVEVEPEPEPEQSSIFD
jgi:hypothetical protein